MTEIEEEEDARAGVSVEASQNSGEEHTDTFYRRVYHWLRPTMKEQGRKGFLSTYEEWHVLLFGLMVGVGVPAGGLLELMATILGSGAAAVRITKGLPEKYTESVKRELPHFIVGTIIGYYVVQLTGGIPI